MALLNTHETLATDDEVWRYYEIETRIKLKNYVEELPVTNWFNGCPRNEVASRMESFMVWGNQDQKRQERRRVKQELPELELAFQRISQEKIPKNEAKLSRKKAIEMQKMDKFKKRLEKEQEEADYQAYKLKMRLAKQQEEAEYQAYKLRHTAVHLDPSVSVVDARCA